MDDKSYVLKWYQGENPRILYFIRGLFPDRTFHGEVRMFTNEDGAQRTIHGQVSEQDYSKVQALIEEIGRTSTDDNAEAPWDGLIAEFPIAKPRIIYWYRPTLREPSAEERNFLGIVEILSRYVSVF